MYTRDRYVQLKRSLKHVPNIVMGDIWHLGACWSILEHVIGLVTQSLEQLERSMLLVVQTLGFRS